MALCSMTRNVLLVLLVSKVSMVKIVDNKLEDNYFRRFLPHQSSKYRNSCIG